MLRTAAAAFALAATGGAEAHRLGEKGHGVRGFVAPPVDLPAGAAVGPADVRHHPFPRMGGGWHERMGAARDALAAEGMDFSWEPSSQGGRAVMWLDSDHVACVASSPEAGREDDTVVLVAGGANRP